MILALAAALVLGSCEPGVAPTRDPEAAALYLQIGEEELARGDRAAAREAFLQAVRLHPDNARAQAAWRGVCRDADANLTTALQQVRAGDCDRAVRTLSALRSRGDSADAALLHGVCLFELGQLEEAKAALRVARRDPGVSDTAALYLGLVSLREGEASAAIDAVRPALEAGDAQTRAAAEALLRVSRDRRRLLLVAGVELLHDSNPYFIPSQLIPTGLPDQAANLFGGVLLRPFGVSGPYLRAAGAWRDMRQTVSFDTVQGLAGLGFQWGNASALARAEYTFDAAGLGGALYAHAHGGELAAALTTELWGVSARYRGRLETVVAAAFQGYSGVRHESALSAERWIAGVGYSLSYELERASAVTPELSHLDHGPRLQARFGAGGPHALRVWARYRLRPFDQIDPALGVRREDRLVEAAVSYEAQLNEAVSLQLSATAASAQSNVAAFQYLRGALTAGLTFTGGGL